LHEWHHAAVVTYYRKLETSVRTTCFALAAGGLVACACALAQRLDQPTPPLEKASAVQPTVFAGVPSATRLYTGENKSTTVFDTTFGGYRTDPKLMFGVQLNPNVAVEAGYANLFSRGFHFVDYGRSDERSGALGTRGFSSYLAGKLAVPLGEQVSAWGKLGIAYSQQVAHDRAGLRVRDGDVGAYANVGARYKLNDRISVSGELTRSGDTANKWGGTSNATGASASLKVGF
jgi:hypothetical protein